MKIKRSSWHYRYLVWMGIYPHQMHTHCEYFTALLITPLLATLKWAFLLAFAALVLSGALFILYMLIVTPGLALLGLAYNEEVLHTGFTLWTFIAVTAALVTLAAFLTGISQHIGQAVEDWRDKKCTRIDFED